MKTFLLSFFIMFGVLFGTPTIPVVDLLDFYDISKREQLIEDVSNALHEYGFFAVKNSGIDQKVIDSAYNSMIDFFSQDIEYKERYNAQLNNFQRGYVPFYTEKAKNKEFSDCKEFWHMGREFSEEDQLKYGHWINVYSDLPDFRNNLMNYMDELDQYIIPLQEIFALSLGVEEDFFCKQTEKGDCLLRAIHYPDSLSENYSEESMWAEEHTDIDLFTILPRSTEDGLELQMPNGEFIPVKVDEDSIVVNGGDFLEIFSNGYFRSAVHRVKKQSEFGERYSMVYFIHPKSNDIIYPLPKAILKTGGVQKYAIATRIEMLMERFADLRIATDETLEELEANKVLLRLSQFGRDSEDARAYLLEKRG